MSPLADALEVSIDELCGVAKMRTVEDELREKVDRTIGTSRTQDLAQSP